MLWRTSKRQAFIAAFTLGVIATFHSAKAETAFTAGVLLEKMPAADRFTFVAGVVEGLAYARYLADGKQADGQACIYRWFYETPGVTQKIYAAFERYPDYMPGPIIAALTRQKCGG